MIDLHFHALPGLDDGPATTDDALALCAAAAADGTVIAVATPHISFEYPEIDAATVQAGVRTLRAELRRAGIALDLRAGGEVALTRAIELPDEELRALTLGESSTVLLELPWHATGSGMAAAVARVADRGFQVLIAHPERTPLLRDDPDLVRGLVESGACCCINAASLSGRAARRTTAAARHLLAEGLVHAIVSDAHDTVGRRPAVRSILATAGFSRAELTYFTEEGPRALLEGASPGPPPLVGRPRARLPWRRA
ncbi:MAG TPA: CpsB/CapC family capsule biosynthesis tyrosine phosphatase [Solirubrobacteraceae bacterium]|nr:CpsB/CapC family capsule biosynthesis tyrosine phosphatase [Solirubrobacteraceae bacterium]